MERAGTAKRLTIFAGESDRYRHHSAVAEIAERARRAGLAGCSVERIESFLPHLEELVTGGLMIPDDVHVVRYVGNPHGRSTGTG
ncbi:MAG: DUF190 domain-containing protein [Frankiaceae bacterium]